MSSERPRVCARRSAPALFVLVLATVTAVAALGALRPSAAWAIETETFRLVPSPLEVQGYERRTFSFALEPGDTASDAIRITNTTEEPRRFRLYGADAIADASGAVTVADSSTPPTGVGGWIELPTDEVEVGPGGSEVIEFSVQRPGDASAAGLGAVVAEEVLSAPDEEGIDVLYRLAILVRLDGDVAGLRVGEPRLDPPVELFPSRSDAVVELRNETLQRITANVSFTTGGLTGRYWELDEQDVELDAGETHAVSAEWTTVPRWGGYFEPAVSVAWEGGSIVRTGSRSLHPPLWLLALAIVVVGVRTGRELLDQRSASRPARV